MENNLDDILIDPLEERQKNPKSKRWVLIGVALVLLIAVVAIVLYFIFVKKEENKGLEAIHTELERFEANAQRQSIESQKDDEFDKLIAEIKAKHQDTSPQITPQQQTQSNEDFKIAGDVKAQEMQKDQNKDLIKVLQQTQGVKPQENPSPKENQNIKQTPMQSPSNKKEKVIQKTLEDKKNKTSSSSKLSVSNVFDSLEIPKGFYLQVGVFSNTPNADFLSKLSTFPYHIEKFNKQGKIVNRYLIGPFKTSREVEAKIPEVTQKITKPVVVEIR